MSWQSKANKYGSKVLGKLLPKRNLENNNKENKIFALYAASCKWQRKDRAAAKRKISRLTHAANAAGQVMHHLQVVGFNAASD